MARGPSKQKSGNATKQASRGRRKATAHEKAVLQAAKARGLTTVDLRKPLSRHARDLVKKFEGVYRQETSVVKVPKKDRAKIKGVEYARGYALVPKKSLYETARFDKGTGRIKVFDRKSGTVRQVGRRVNFKTRTVVIFAEGTSKQRKRTYSGGGGGGGAAAMAAYLKSYSDEVLEDANIFDEYYDPFDNEWHRYEHEHEDLD